MEYIFTLILQHEDYEPPIPEMVFEGTVKVMLSGEAYLIEKIMAKLRELGEVK